MKLIDTSKQLLYCYDSGVFDLEKWKKYADDCVPGAKELCLEDLRETLAAGFSWEKDFLPVLNGVFECGEKREEALRSFYAVTENLDARLKKRFHKTVEADLILYLGLCCGAGWVTPVNGRESVLFGIEKIIELDWCGLDAMNGLVLHELGHIFHRQHGLWLPEPEANADRFIRRLFTEGVAMVFEQELAGGAEYYHQYDGEWKAWCDENAEHIKQSFFNDLSGMTNENQRYFGDWALFEGRGDTGYYLGARFVRFLMRRADLTELICFDLPEIKRGFDDFMLFKLGDDRPLHGNSEQNVIEKEQKAMLVSELKKETLTPELVDRLLFNGLEDGGESADCIMILGSGKAAKYRVPAAVAAYKSGRAPKLLLSGGVVRDFPEGRMNEAENMRLRALELGVSDDDIILETESQNTVENMLCSLLCLQRALLISRVKRVLLVTSAYHMRRSLAIARRLFPAHIEVLPCPANDTNTRRDNWMNNDAGRRRALDEAAKVIDGVRTELFPDFKI